MKSFITFLFISISTLACGQFMYTRIPLDSQLVARSVHSNMGFIEVSGYTDSSRNKVDSICMKLFRGTMLYDSITECLHYTGNKATFDFKDSIFAELKEYTLSLYGIKNGILTLDTTIYALVAGDIFIIDGQSNALAAMRDSGSADVNKSEFIRVFGNSDSSTRGLLANLRWFRGEGDGFFKENGHAGQWGLRMGRLLIDSIKIPVAIFNNGCGGTPISYYERLANYKTNLYSNYARLYYRLTYTGLQNNVSAIIWSQGETDALDGTGTAKYLTEFDTLRKSFMQDFPGFKKLYLFQTRNGCIANIYDLAKVKEAQREAAIQYDTSVEIMSTSALKQDTGDCHFDYKGGYEIFGNRIYALISRDIYEVAATREIDAPMIENAYLTDSTTLVVEEDADSLIQHDFGKPISNYEIENSNGAIIDTIYLNRNNIIFKLSKYPGTAITVSYLAQYGDSANWLTNTNDIEVLCFYKYPVSDSLLTVSTGIVESVSSTMKVYPNPFSNFTKINIGIEGYHILELDDLTGRKLKTIEFTGTTYTLSAEGLAKGMYFIRVMDKDKNVVGTSKIVVQ